jgi:PhzF family phenazine biosynthesis protein
MNVPYYQIDAFTNTLFKGNPACVVPLENWLSDDLLLKIAEENAVAETAFFVKKNQKFHLRWFTPEIEMDLCGHATLATAHVLKTILNYENNTIVFETLSGELIVTIEDEMYCLDFPSREPISATLPENLKLSLNIQPKEVYKSRDYFLVYDKEEDVKNLKINRLFFDKLNFGSGGVIFTSKGTDCDFVSRFFITQASILEDPVTGSAHCSLIPFWSRRLQKKKLFAKQISKRGGELYCTYKNERVHIKGKAKTYSIGKIWIE